MSAKKTTSQDHLKPVESAVNTGKETVEAVMKAGSDAATRQYEQAVALTKEQVEKTSTAIFKGYDEITALNKANLDAVVASSTLFAKGMEQISKQLLGLAQGSVEQNLAAAKKIFGARNVQEVVDLQSELARSNFDKLLAESAKLTEFSMQVASEAFEPLQARMQETVEKIVKTAA